MTTKLMSDVTMDGECKWEQSIFIYFRNPPIPTVGEGAICGDTKPNQPPIVLRGSRNWAQSCTTYHSFTLLAASSRWPVKIRKRLFQDDGPRRL